MKHSMKITKSTLLENDEYIQQSRNDWKRSSDNIQKNLRGKAQTLTKIDAISGSLPGLTISSGLS